MGILEGRVAILTGAGKGLGKYEAWALAKEGATVVCVARTLSAVEETAKEIEGFGGRALAISCDVSDREQVDACVARTIEELGRVDFLINNAQIIPPSTPIMEWTEQMMRDTWESGLLGSYFFMQAVFPHMKEAGGGRIINTSSGSGHGNLPGTLGYACTKEAIRALTRMAAREWGQHNILVNVIAPAAITPGALECMDEEMERNILAMFAVPRWGKAEEEVGRTVVFLCSPDSGYMTGNTISVDGGAAMVV